MVILADPALEVIFANYPKPVIWVLLDGSDSMSIRDELRAAEKNSLAQAVDLDGYLGSNPPTSAQATPTRADYARAMLSKVNRNLVRRLSDNFRLRFFSFAEPEAVRAIVAGETDDGRLVAREWQTTGSMTALGDALDELSRQHATDHLAGVLVISDFDQNVGLSAVASAKKLEVPVFTVGVGPVSAVDLSIDLFVSPTIKKEKHRRSASRSNNVSWINQPIHVRRGGSSVSGCHFR